jgi:hypothetical protein
MASASFLAALDGAAIAALVALEANRQTHWSLIIMVIGFAIAAILALLAAQPVVWEIAGSRPNSWVEDIKSGGDLHNSRAAMAWFYDEMIADNDATMASTANLLRGSLVAMIVTLVMADLAVIIVR